MVSGTNRSLSRVSAVLCAIVAALIIADGRASAHAPSKDFVLSYAASGMQPGRHFDLTVTASVGTVAVRGATPRATIGGMPVAALEPAAQALRWSFIVPAGGTVAAKSFRFAFPHPVVAALGPTRVFLTVDCSFEGVDQQRRPAVVHTRGTLAVPVGRNGPEAGLRCLQLSGRPNGAFLINLKSDCGGL